MKKLLILLLLPLFSFSQTYKEVMSIKSLDTFKKVSIENNYEQSDSEQEGLVTYGYDISKDDDGNKSSSKWAYYIPKNDMFFFAFSRGNAMSEFFGTEVDNSENPYDLILKDVKDKCSYHKIVNHEGTDFVTYSCPESSYKGKLGFAIKSVDYQTGIIMHFHKE